MRLRGRRVGRERCVCRLACYTLQRGQVGSAAVGDDVSAQQAACLEQAEFRGMWSRLGLR